MPNNVLADLFDRASSRQGPGPQLSKPDVFGSSPTPAVKKKKPKRPSYLEDNSDDDMDDE